MASITGKFRDVPKVKWANHAAGKAAVAAWLAALAFHSAPASGQWVISVQARFGACCTGDGCIVTRPQNCTGLFMGIGTSCPLADCDRDGSPNACDIALGVSLDQDGNGVPDECEVNCPKPCDPWETITGTHHDFFFTPLPAGFFGQNPASLPFDQDVELIGDPIDPDKFGATDTLVARAADPVNPSDPPGTWGYTTLQINTLSMKSASPITVDYADGSRKLWDVFVGLSVVPPPQGYMYAQKIDDNSGTYDSQLWVQPRFVFRRTDNPGKVAVYDTGSQNLFAMMFGSLGTPWVHDVGATAELFTCLSENFVSGASNQGINAEAEDIPEEEKKTSVDHKVHIPPPPPTGCSAACDPDLVIYNGQSGSAVAEADEESVGAFTVANLNDTDCDGTVDKDDMSVKKTGANGRDEVDLMQLDVKATGNPNDDVILSLAGGSAKVWRQSTKEVEIALPKTYKISELPVTVWVEATAASASLRDIALKLKCAASSDTDVAKATGVWSTVTLASHDRVTAAALIADPNWANLTDPPKNYVQLLDGTGNTPLTAANGIHNVILIKFTMTPPGIHNETTVAFDGSRRAERKSWLFFSGQACSDWGAPFPSFPADCDQPNDDPAHNDKTNALSSDEFFDLDAPGDWQDGSGAPADFALYRANFQEFLRMSTNGTRPADNQNVASRCSPFYDWHARLRLQKATPTATWTRTDGEPPAAETANNDIGPGHISLGTCP